MKKHVLAAAVASVLVAPAMAQQVTVYGVIDGGYATIKQDSGTATTKQSMVGGLVSGNGTGTLSGSRLGFKASEDLGGGVKLDLVLENGVNFSGGNASATTVGSSTAGANTNAQQILSANTRAAWVQLSSNSMGSVRLGTQDSLFKIHTEGYAADGGVALTGSSSHYQNNAVTTRPGSAITYTLPTIAAGVTAQVAMMNSGRPSNNTIESNASGTSYAIDYKTGALGAVLVYERYKDVYRAANREIVDLVYDVTASNGSAVVVDKNEARAVALKYDLGAVSLRLVNYSVKDTDSDVTAVVDNKGNSFGAIYKAGANTFTATITRGKLLRQNVSADYKTSGYQLMAVRDLSKRTNVYFAMGQSKWDLTSSSSDITRSDTGIGLRHSF